MKLFAPIQIDDHLAELAHHYSRSSNIEKTVEYLDRAGQQAMMRGALKEAELYLKQAIAALSTTPETPERIKREFNLQYALWQVLAFTSGWRAVVRLCWRARRLRELGEKIGNPEQLIAALGATWGSAFCAGRNDCRAADRRTMLEIAQRSGSRYGLTLAHLYQGLVFAVSRRADSGEATFRGDDRVIQRDRLLWVHLWTLMSGRCRGSA